jgi:two-component system, NtrC family, response regulator PilR
MNKRYVLVVDDEADIRDLLELTLQRMGLETKTAGAVGAAKRLLEQQSFDLCLTDMRLPDETGLDLLSHISKQYPGLPVAVITAYGSTENAVAALKAGAFDYLAKPIAVNQLRDLVKAALKLPQQGAEKKTAAAPETAPSNDTPSLIGDSKRIRQAREMIDKLARSQAPVYITGESGSGKEVAARMIHAGSARAEGPFVGVNCGAIPETLMESEFFGYKKGAFTGANTDRDGFFQAARGGTLFLDEVADLPLAMQVKLLRVIQEKKVRKVGDTNEEHVDVRIVSATHKNLGELVQSGQFRQDLYYRLNVIELKMPALRDMPEDVPLIARALLARLAREAGTPMPGIAKDAEEGLQAYDFPGNVRELENILERALALCAGEEIRRSDLYLADAPMKLEEPAPEEVVAVAGGGGGESGPNLQDYLDRVEKQAIMKALEKTRFNKTAAAKLLGITFRALRYRMERLRIE